jgi:hypothetical protein
MVSVCTMHGIEEAYLQGLGRKIVRKEGIWVGG